MNHGSQFCIRHSISTLTCSHARPCSWMASLQICEHMLTSAVYATIGGLSPVTASATASSRSSAEVDIGTPLPKRAWFGRPA
eukprot:7390919-Prymnesium_polylepis.2